MKSVEYDTCAAHYNCVQEYVSSMVCAREDPSNLVLRHCKTRKDIKTIILLLCNERGPRVNQRGDFFTLCILVESGAGTACLWARPVVQGNSGGI